MADNNLQASFRKLMRYAENLAEYDKGIADGIIDENVFVIVLAEKCAKFKGQTFDWSGGGAEIDSELSDTSENAVQNKTVTAALATKQDVISDLETIRSGAALGATAIQEVKTINGQSIVGKGDIKIEGGGGSIDPALLEGYMPMMREFSDDFNNDFAR